MRYFKVKNAYWFAKHLSILAADNPTTLANVVLQVAPTYVEGRLELHTTAMYSREVAN